MEITSAQERIHISRFPRIFKELFKGLKGFVILDTLENSSKIAKEFERFKIDLEILGTKQVGCKGVKHVIREAIEKQMQV